MEDITVKLSNVEIAGLIGLIEKIIEDTSTIKKLTLNMKQNRSFLLVISTKLMTAYLSRSRTKGGENK